MDNYGCMWNRFEANDRYLDTVQYALHAGARGSIPLTSTTVIRPEETVNCGGLFVWLLTLSLSLLTKVLTTPMYRWYRSFRQGRFPLNMYER